MNNTQLDRIEAMLIQVLLNQGTLADNQMKLADMNRSITSITRENNVYVDLQRSCQSIMQRVLEITR